MRRKNKMYNVEIFSTFYIDVNFKTKVPCELYIDLIPKTPKKNLRILWVMEPDIISKLSQDIIENKEKFDLILTFDEKILTNCENSKLFLYGTTWIRDFDFDKMKEYCITSLIGGKTFTVGHRMRHDLINKKKLIKSIPIHLYNSINNPIEETEDLNKVKSTLWKNELFYSQYHIAIENSSSKNYFTEKIIDCFQTKTIPIYFGCQNIKNFFNEKSIITFSSMDDLVEKCNSITDELYLEKIEYIEENFIKSFDFVDYGKRVEKEINFFIKKSQIK